MNLNTNDRTTSEKYSSVNQKLKKTLLTTIKILISLGLLGLVLYNLDLPKVKKLFLEADLVYFSLAVAMFILSQLVSVLRIDMFFKSIGIRLKFLVNSKLFLLGMFYNFFIPGGIGGDAYKIYILNKQYKTSLRQLALVVFLDRFIGLIAIGFLLCALFFFVDFPLPAYWKYASLLIGFVGTFFVIWILAKFFTRHRDVYYPAFGYSLLVQFFQILCVICILKALHNESQDFMIYILIFLASSVLSVFSFAGIGIREVVFYYGGLWLNFDPDLSVSIALVFSLITAGVSFFGIIYLFRKIKFT